MTDTPRKPRGRPPGSSRYANTDPALLARIGDLMVADPDMSMRAAILQVGGGGRGESWLSRLQRKFRAAEGEILAAARERAKPRPAAPMPARQPSGNALALQNLQRLTAHTQCGLPPNFHSVAREMRMAQEQADTFRKAMGLQDANTLAKVMAGINLQPPFDIAKAIAAAETESFATASARLAEEDRRRTADLLRLGLSDLTRWTK